MKEPTLCDICHNKIIPGKQQEYRKVDGKSYHVYHQDCYDEAEYLNHRYHGASGFAKFAGLVLIAWGVISLFTSSSTLSSISLIVGGLIAIIINILCNSANIRAMKKFGKQFADADPDKGDKNA